MTDAQSQLRAIDRRRFLLRAAMGTTVAIGLAACGSDDATAESSAPAASSAPATSEAATT